MDNLILSLNIVLPLLVMMAVGNIAHRTGLCDSRTSNKMNNLVFRLFMPILIFNNIRKASFESLDGVSVLAFTCAVLIIEFIIFMILVPRLIRENARRGVVVQALFRSNYALFGMAIVQNMFPGEVLTIPSLMIPATVPIYNVLAVICLEAFRGGKVDLRSTLLKILTNPLIIASALGIAALVAGNPMPAFLDSALKSLGNIATPLALFVLGADFSLRSMQGNRLLISVITFLKLIVIPGAVMTIAILLGYHGQGLASVLVAVGGPIAVSSYTMAQQMDGDAELAGQLVVVTTALSVASLFLFIFIMKELRLV